MEERNLEQIAVLSDAQVEQIRRDARYFLDNHPSHSPPIEDYIKYFRNKMELLESTLYATIQKENLPAKEKLETGLDMSALFISDKNEAMKELLFYSAVIGELLAIRLRDKTFRSINYDRFRNSAGQNQAALLLKYIKAID